MKISLITLRMSCSRLKLPTVTHGSRYHSGQTSLTFMRELCLSNPSSATFNQLGGKLLKWISSTMMVRSTPSTPPLPCLQSSVGTLTCSEPTTRCSSRSTRGQMMPTRTATTTVPPSCMCTVERRRRSSSLGEYSSLTVHLRCSQTGTTAEEEEEVTRWRKLREFPSSPDHLVYVILPIGSLVIM